jgi:hypothetical protein
MSVGRAGAPGSAPRRHIGLTKRLLAIFHKQVRMAFLPASNVASFS